MCPVAYDRSPGPDPTAGRNDAGRCFVGVTRAFHFGIGELGHGRGSCNRGAANRSETGAGTDAGPPMPVRDLLIDLLARNKSELRRAVSKQLTLKFAPDLRFRLDETFDRLDDTRRLFSQDNVRRDLDD